MIETTVVTRAEPYVVKYLQKVPKFFEENYIRYKLPKKILGPQIFLLHRHCKKSQAQKFFLGSLQSRSGFGGVALHRSRFVLVSSMQRYNIV